MGKGKKVAIVNRKVTFFFLLMTSTILLSGCWSKKELTDLAIVAALGVDKTEDGKYAHNPADHQSRERGRGHARRRRRDSKPACYDLFGYRG